MIEGTDAIRATAAANRLADVSANSGIRGRVVRVLNADCPCAYAWPDGSVFVTRGLVKLLDEDELAAAIAHELGHVESPASLSGTEAAADDIEMRADDAGRALLRSAGVPEGALTHALMKVRQAAETPENRKDLLSRRIRRLPGGEPG